MAGKVGFIGLGIMGKPMAHNLMRAGYELVVYTRSREKADGLAEEGATTAASPREVAELCDLIVTMPPDSANLREVVPGIPGVLGGMAQGSLLLEMTTVSPLITEEAAAHVEARGAGMLNARASGG